MGGEAGGRFVRAMMCWRVMSVWVLMSVNWEFAVGLTRLAYGARRRTWTIMGSLAVRKASTACSWVALERSLPLTCRRKQRERNQKASCGSMERKQEGNYECATVTSFFFSTWCCGLLDWGAYSLFQTDVNTYPRWWRPHMRHCGNTHTAVAFCLSNDSLLPQLVFQGHSQTK